MGIYVVIGLAVWLCTLLAIGYGYYMGVMAPHIDKRETQKAQERQIPLTAQSQKAKPAKQQPVLQQHGASN